MLSMILSAGELSDEIGTMIRSQRLYANRDQKPWQDDVPPAELLEQVKQKLDRLIASWAVQYSIDVSKFSRSIQHEAKRCKNGQRKAWGYGYWRYLGVM